MKIAADFKAALRQHIDSMNARGLRRRPVQLNIDEAIDDLFKLVRTGMQWREVQLRSASYSTLFKHVPFVPIGCVVTAGILASGLGNFAKVGSRKNSIKSQKLMRARVLAQGVTVAFLAWGTFYANYQAKERELDIQNGGIPRDKVDPDQE